MAFAMVWVPGAGSQWSRCGTRGLALAREKRNLSYGPGYPETYCASLPADFPTLGRLDEATLRVVFSGTLNHVDARSTSRVAAEHVRSDQGVPGHPPRASGR